MRLKNVYLRLDGTWVHSSTVKCMHNEFVRENIGRTRSINYELDFLLKKGYIEIRQTQAGREFEERYLKLYEQREQRLISAAKKRRRMRYIAQRGTFCLDKVVSHQEPYSTVYGHYADVEVVAEEVGYIRLKREQEMTFINKGKLYEKILTDIANVLMSPKGKLWVVKVGVSRVKWFLKWHKIN